MKSKILGVVSACVAIVIALVLTIPAPSVVLAENGHGANTVKALAGPGRTVNYTWWGMFGVPFGEWWDLRSAVYGTPVNMSTSYPYIYQELGTPAGNDYFYSNMRLSIVGQDMSELNMSSRPEFLPYLGTERGGNASIDWNMSYLTTADAARYPGSVAANMDGWIVGLNGTVALDRQASKAVLGITDAEFDAFSSWWTPNHHNVETDFSNWLAVEASTRLDIYNMYESDFQQLYWALSATKVGETVVLGYDLVSWGMEALMARWFHEAFMPSEYYYEGMKLHAEIGPQQAYLNVSTVVDYAVYAALDLSQGGMPYWGWEPMLGDYLSSTPLHPQSEFDPYVGYSYTVDAVGNAYIGTNMSYDYTPAAWNLSAGETLNFIWPTGNQTFLADDGMGNVVPIDLPMFAYPEPSSADLAGVAIDYPAGTLTFTGPMDLWNWSRTQTSDQALADQWASMGILPLGTPFIEFYPDFAPFAFIQVTPSTGDTSIVFTFDASFSFDLEDGWDLQYRWDWNGDGIWDTGWQTTNLTTHQFSTAGTYDVILEVMDSVGQTGLANQTVIVTAPTIIPEFSSVLVPLSGMLVLMVVMAASRRRRERN